MKRYLVQVQQIRVRECEVEAVDEKDAEKKAILTVKREGIINHKTPVYKTLVTYKGAK